MSKFINQYLFNKLNKSKKISKEKEKKKKIKMTSIKKMID